MRDERSRSSRAVDSHDFLPRANPREHTITIERLADPEPGVLYPRLVEVLGRCSPEDCGGPFGYAELLDAITNPKQERHAELTEWIGDDFDPKADDAEALTAEVAALAKSWSRKSTRKRSKSV